MAVIAVFNQKGGVGKTTTCLNVAASLAMLGRNPLAIDLDPQAHLSLACGVSSINASESISAFYRDEKSLEELIRHLPTGLRLIPSNLDLSKVEAGCIEITLLGTVVVVEISMPVLCKLQAKGFVE